MAEATYTLEIDWDNSGAFVDPYADEDVTADLISASIRRGFSNPLARVAVTGRATFTLDNTTKAYSPPLVANVVPDRPVRFQMTYDGTTTTLFRGFIDEIIPDTDQHGRRQVRVECVDALDLMDRFEGEIAIQTNVYADDVIEAVVAACYTPPSTDYEVGLNLYPLSCERWAWTTGGSWQGEGRGNAPTETVKAVDRIADACTGDWGKFFIKGDGAPAYYNRHHMPLDATAAIALDNAMIEMGYRKAAETIFNHVEVTVNPRTIGQKREVVGRMSQSRAPRIEASASATYILRFRDPSNTARQIGAGACLTPVAGTDYTTTDDVEGAGTNMDASVTAAATFYGDYAEVTLTNAAAAPVWVQKLQVRGFAIRSQDTITVSDSDATSIAAYGKRRLAMHVPMMSAPEDAQTLATHLLGVYKDPVDEVRGISFVANETVALMEAARDLELLDKIELTETQTGLSALTCHVFALEHAIDQECNHRVTISVETPYVLGTPFRLDSSTLDSGDTLIY